MSTSGYSKNSLRSGQDQARGRRGPEGDATVPQGPPATRVDGRSPSSSQDLFPPSPPSSTGTALFTTANVPPAMGNDRRLAEPGALAVPAEAGTSRGGKPRRTPRPRKVYIREGRLDPFWDWSATTKEMPINKDRKVGSGDVVRASKESRALFAERLFDDEVFTSPKQKYKFLDCVMGWKQSKDGYHEWWIPFGTCGLEQCSVCVIHRERERARLAWRGMGGWGTQLTQVFTIPEQFVDRIDSVKVQADLENLCTWVVERYVVMRESLEGQGWRIGVRWDWDLSGDKSPGKYRPHLNGTVPAYLHRRVDGLHELRTFDPILDVDEIRNLFRLSLTLYFAERPEEDAVRCARKSGSRCCNKVAWEGFRRLPGRDGVLPELVAVDPVRTAPDCKDRRIAAVDMWSRYARTVEPKRHWSKYGVMHVADELTYDGMTAEEIDRTVDLRLWKLQRRGHFTGWMQARKGWSVEEIRIEAAKKDYWRDVLLEPSFKLVKGGKPGPETGEVDLWRALANGDAAAVAELRRRRCMDAPSSSLPGGEVISTTLPTREPDSRPSPVESFREPGQDEELDGVATKAEGFCPICGRRAISARVFTEEMRPPLSRLRSGVFVRTEMLPAYREEIATRRRQKEERRDAARLYRIAEKAKSSSGIVA